MGNSVFDAMIEAMLKNSSSKLMSGDYSQAIDESTKYLSSIEGLKPEVKTACLLLILFAEALIKSYKYQVVINNWILGLFI